MLLYGPIGIVNHHGIILPLADIMQAISTCRRSIAILPYKFEIFQNSEANAIRSHFFFNMLELLLASFLLK